MTDEIYKNSYAGEVPAWHNRGISVGHAFSAEEAIQYGGLDYEVVRIPLVTQDGQAIDRFATARTDLPVGDPDRILGVVGPGYRVVQNCNAFLFFDEVVGEGKAVFSSVGALGHGERIFLVARIPKEFYVAQDKFEEYVVLNNAHNGAYSLRIFTSAVRVVCQNTLMRALGKTANRVNLRHTLNVHDRMIDAVSVLGLADQQFQQTQRMFNAMVRPVSHPLFTRYINELFPAEKPSKRTLAHRDSVTALFDHEYNSTSGIKHTWYSAAQATIQYVDHVMSTRTDKVDNVLFGSGAQKKRKAVELAWNFSQGRI